MFFLQLGSATAASTLSEQSARSAWGFGKSTFRIMFVLTVLYGSALFAETQAQLFAGWREGDENILQSEVIASELQKAEERAIAAEAQVAMGAARIAELERKMHTQEQRIRAVEEHLEHQSDALKAAELQARASAQSAPRSLFPWWGKPSPSHSIPQLNVKLHVQQTMGMYKLPINQSPSSLMKFLNDRSSIKYTSQSSSSGTSVYASIAEDNRLGEVIDKDQLRKSKAKAFIAILIKRPNHCIDGRATQGIEQYIRSEFPQIVDVGFVCFWNTSDDSNTGFTPAAFSDQSLKELDGNLQNLVRTGQP